MSFRVSQALSRQSAKTVCSTCTSRSTVKAFQGTTPRRNSLPGLRKKSTSNATSTLTKAANTDTEALRSVDIENQSRDYCDDFVCTSSPAIEQTVKSFARDIMRLKHTTALYQPDTLYKDGFRSFKGRENYTHLNWPRDLLSKPTAEVVRLQMLDKGVAQADWVLRGVVANTDVRIPIVSKFTMNLLTGRITDHSESWDLKGVSPLAAAVLTVSRLILSLKDISRDAGDNIAKASASLSSMDDENNGVYMNPNDPTRFFQPQQNNQMTDAFTIATVVAALYFVYKAFEAIETLN